MRSTRNTRYLTIMYGRTFTFAGILMVGFATAAAPALAQTIADCDRAPVQITVAVTSEVPSPIFTGQEVWLRITEPVADRKISRVVVLVNGRSALEMGSEQLSNLREGRAVEFPLEVAVGGREPYKLNLEPDKHATVVVFAYDSGSANPANCGYATFALRTGKIGTFAVVLGFNYTGYPYGLRWAQHDAEAVVRHLIERRKLPRENIWLLTDDAEATQKFPLPLNVQLGPKPADLRELLKRIQNGADSSSTLYFYFSGHVLATQGTDGVSEKYLVFGGSALDDTDTMLSRSKLFQLLSGQNSKSISILDACYSGTVVAAYASVRTGPSRAKLLGEAYRGNDSLPALSRAARIASSRANRLSWEFDELKHGVFTHYLLEAGADPQRDVTIMNAFDHAVERVKAYRPSAADIDYRQEPDAEWNHEVSRELWSLRVSGSQ